MNTLEIRPGNSGVKLYLNGVELEDVVRYSLASADLQRAEFTVTVKIEHPHAGFAPADIIDFASEIKRVPVKLDPKHLANVIHGTEDSEKFVCPVNCSLEDLGIPDR